MTIIYYNPTKKYYIYILKNIIIYLLTHSNWVGSLLLLEDKNILIYYYYGKRIQ